MCTSVLGSLLAHKVFGVSSGLWKEVDLWADELVKHALPVNAARAQGSVSRAWSGFQSSPPQLSDFVQ